MAEYESASEVFRTPDQWDGSDKEVHWVSLAHKYAGSIQDVETELTNQQIYCMKVKPSDDLPVDHDHDEQRIGLFEATDSGEDCSLVTLHTLDDTDALRRVQRGIDSYVSLSYAIGGVNHRFPIGLATCARPRRRIDAGSRILGFCDEIPTTRRIGAGITWHGGLRGSPPGTYVPREERFATPSEQALPVRWDAVETGSKYGWEFQQRPQHNASFSSFRHQLQKQTVLRIVYL